MPTRAYKRTFPVRWLMPPVVTLLYANTIGPASFTAPMALRAAGLTVVLMWLSTLLHELGHVAAGRASGMRVTTFSVGWLTIDWTSGKRVIAFGPLPGGVAGRVCFAPTPATRESATSQTVMSFGGPFAELMFGFALSLASGSADGWIALGLTLGSWWSWANVALNLLPVQAGFLVTDGEAIRRMIRRDQRAIDHLAVGIWMQAYLGPTAPAEWPADTVRDLDRALAHQPPLADYQIERARLAGSLLYLHYVDLGQWSEATQVITLATDLPRRQRPKSIDDAADLTNVLHAFHLATRGRNVAAARMALGLIHPKAAMVKNSLYIGVQATIALVEGNQSAARGLAEEAKRILEPTVARVGVDRLEAAWWDAVIAATSGETKPAAPAHARQARPLAALPARPALPAPAFAFQDNLFKWDPGVPSDLRTVWIRRPMDEGSSDLPLSA